MTIGQRIKELRQAAGMSADELAERLGKNRATIYRYESDEIRKLPLDVLKSLADVFGITPGELFDDYSVPDLLPIGIQRLPVYDGIACGEPRFADSKIEFYVDVTTGIKADFVLRAHGDSMTGARIHDGDLVFIRRQATVENGEIAAVLIDDSATLKRVFWYANKAILVLRAENPEYKDIEITGSELEAVKILGKAVAFQSDVR